MKDAEAELVCDDERSFALKIAGVLSGISAIVADLLVLISLNILNLRLVNIDTMESSIQVMVHSRRTAKTPIAQYVAVNAWEASIVKISERDNTL